MIYDLEKLQKLLSDRKLSVVAESTKLHENTLRKVLAGKGCNLGTAKKLTQYFESQINEQ